ncbi:hypothetical protein, partial [uncultured Bacteroides sp.]|uniref:hypothetical protein n=3 Tax=uncultured Bacteroides sp. TaxID=162156 RepID=UPI00262435D3
GIFKTKETFKAKETFRVEETFLKKRIPLKLRKPLKLRRSLKKKIKTVSKIWPLSKKRQKRQFFFNTILFVIIIKKMTINQKNRVIKKGKKKVDKSTESTNVQVVKKKRGPKRSAEITRITNQRRVIGKAYLELYVNNCLDVKWGNGLMALARFLQYGKGYVKKSGEDLAINTIRIELGELLKEILEEKPKGRKKF